MKLLVLSDAVDQMLYRPSVARTHGDVDAIISCGDLPFDYLEYVVTLLGKPFYYVLGNHDHPMLREDGSHLRAPEGGVQLDGRMERLRTPGGEALTLAGMSGSMFYGGSDHQLTESQMSARIRRLSIRARWMRRTSGRCVDVFVTHAPPAGAHEGKDLCHRGFRSFARFLRVHRPAFHLHGHIHPTYGIDMAPRTLGRTRVISVFRSMVLEIDST